MASRYLTVLVPFITAGPLGRTPEGYETFKHGQGDGTKVVLSV
jgi:hypothetical protein